jgi:hypothetical protein
MVFNAKNLKNLFKRLAPYADDVVRSADVSKGLVNAADVGTDLARYSGNFKTDDVLDIVNAYSKTPVTGLGDDFVELGGKMFHYPVGNTPQDLLKGQLLSKQAGLDSFGDIARALDDTVPLTSAPMSQSAMDAVAESLDDLNSMSLADMASTPAGSVAAKNFRVSPDTYVLGDARVTRDPSHLYPNYKGEFAYLSDDASYTQPLKDLVLDSPDGVGLSIRPHKNTALGRWFDRAKKPLI